MATINLKVSICPGHVCYSRTHSSFWHYLVACRQLRAVVALFLGRSIIMPIGYDVQSGYFSNLTFWRLMSTIVVVPHR